MKIVLILLVPVLLFSCSRGNTGLTLTGNDPEISFDISGMHQSNKGQLGATAVKVSAANFFYMFNGSSGSTSNQNLIFFSVSTDSLKLMTYHLTGNGAVATVNNIGYGYLMPGDFLDVTITEYKNGTVSGTFSGNLSKIVSSNPAVFQPATLTNGVIKNVRIRY